MALFVLDTDILTLFQMNHPKVLEHVAEHLPNELAVSVVTVEEQLSGWYAQLRKAKDTERITWAYRRLAENVRFLARVKILDFDEAAARRYEELKGLRLKTRKMDLQIAATALVQGAILVTRNVRDFKGVPGLTVEDWSR